MTVFQDCTILLLQITVGETDGVTLRKIFFHDETVVGDESSFFDKHCTHVISCYNIKEVLAMSWLLTL